MAVMPEPKLVGTSSTAGEESSTITKLDSISGSADDDLGTIAKAAGGSDNSESSTVAKLLEIVGVLVQSRESCDAIRPETFVLSPAATSLATTPSDTAHSLPPAPRARRRASAPCSRPEDSPRRRSSGQGVARSGADRPRDGNAPDGEDGGELPLPPGGGSWDWPMSRQEKKARITMIDRDVMLSDQRVLRERITELVSDKS